MIAVDRNCEREWLSSRIVLQIHDELLIETAENEVEEVKEILTDKDETCCKFKGFSLKLTRKQVHPGLTQIDHNMDTMRSRSELCARSEQMIC